MIVAVEGIDGSGKSLLARLLVERLRTDGLDADLFDKHEIDLGADFAGRRMAELRALLWPAESEPAEDRLGTHFYLFLLAAWFAGLRGFPAAGAGDPDRVTVADGSFHRVIAKAHLRAGLDFGWLDSLFDRAWRPDLVILLDVEPALAWHRRPAFKQTEIGRWDGAAGDPKAAFAAYQGRVRALLLDFAGRLGWPVIRQNEATRPEDSAGRAHAIVRNLLAARREALTPAGSG
jgi:thymidylate kinase